MGGRNDIVLRACLVAAVATMAVVLVVLALLVSAASAATRTVTTVTPVARDTHSGALNAAVASTVDGLPINTGSLQLAVRAGITSLLAGTKTSDQVIAELDAAW